jgi:putative ABC transport system permease protein
VNTLLQDLRYSARLLWKRRGYGIVVVLTLVVGIGALTSVFSVVNAVFLKPYGPIDANRWVYLWVRGSANHPDVARASRSGRNHHLPPSL